MRVILDTNVLVSAFATRGLCSDVLRCVLADHDLIVSDVILQEFRRALTEKLKAPAAAIASAEEVIRFAVHVVGPPRRSTVRIRDDADGWILASAELGHADALVTGDRDLLELSEKLSFLILSPREFWDLTRKSTKRPR